MNPTIELDIQELTLQGFSPNDAFYISKALEEELARLIEEGGLSEGFSQEAFYGQLVGKSFDFDSSARPQVIGKEIANSIYQRISSQTQKV